MHVHGENRTEASPALVGLSPRAWQFAKASIGQSRRNPRTFAGTIRALGGGLHVPASAAPSSADLFALLWEGLADLLGTAAAATLLRRAAGRAVKTHPELAEMSVVRANLEYRYTLPAAWSDPGADTPPALRKLIGELLPLLAELTGPIAWSRLAQISELQRRGLIPPQEEGR
jgi:hypothetical protein